MTGHTTRKFRICQDPGLKGSPNRRPGVLGERTRDSWPLSTARRRRGIDGEIRFYCRFAPGQNAFPAQTRIYLLYFARFAPWREPALAFLRVFSSQKESLTGALSTVFCWPANVVLRWYWSLWKWRHLGIDLITSGWAPDFRGLYRKLGLVPMRAI